MVVVLVPAAKCSTMDAAATAAAADDDDIVTFYCLLLPPRAGNVTPVVCLYAVCLFVCLLATLHKISNFA